MTILLYLTEAYSYTNDCNRMLKYLEPCLNVCVHVQIHIVSVTQFITNILKMNTVVSKVGVMVVQLANGGTLIYKLWHGSGD